MSDAPKKLWVEWPKANHLDVAYDEPPVSEHDMAQSAYTRSDLCITRAEAEAMVAAEREKWEKLAASPASDPVSKTPTLDAMAVKTKAKQQITLTADLLALAGFSEFADRVKVIAALIDDIQVTPADALAEAMKLPEIKERLEDDVTHSDDVAVNRFARAMKAKLAQARATGRSGWDDPAQCSEAYLAKQLVAHLGKGNPGTFEDVANFAMMLHQRGANPRVLKQATETQSYSEMLAEAMQLPEVKALVEALEGWMQLAANAEMVSGVCCCGDSMEGHSNAMDCGHSPVDMADAYASDRIKETKAVLAALKGASHE